MVLCDQQQRGTGKEQAENGDMFTMPAQGQEAESVQGLWMLPASEDESRRRTMPIRLLVSAFIIVTSVLMEFDGTIEDDELRNMSAVEVGFCKVLVSIANIEMVLELADENRTEIKTIGQEKIYCLNSIDEIIQKINASQVVASIQ